jgi:hypothetical protein
MAQVTPAAVDATPPPDESNGFRKAAKHSVLGSVGDCGAHYWGQDTPLPELPSAWAHPKDGHARPDTNDNPSLARARGATCSLPMLAARGEEVPVLGDRQGAHPVNNAIHPPPHANPSPSRGEGNGAGAQVADRPPVGNSADVSPAMPVSVGDTARRRGSPPAHTAVMSPTASTRNVSQPSTSTLGSHIERPRSPTGTMGPRRPLSPTSQPGLPTSAKATPYQRSWSPVLNPLLEAPNQQPTARTEGAASPRGLPMQEPKHGREVRLSGLPRDATLPSVLALVTDFGLTPTSLRFPPPLVAHLFM